MNLSEDQVAGGTTEFMYLLQTSLREPSEDPGQFPVSIYGFNETFEKFLAKFQDFNKTIITILNSKRFLKYYKSSNVT